MKKIISAIAICMTLVIVMFTGAQAAMFTDVSISTPYRDAIITLSTLGLIKGYEDGSFRPDNTITRAEFTVMVTRALGADNLKIEGDIFEDVTDHYAKYNIRTAYDMGIVNGMGNGTFCPDAPVTYEQAVKMIVCMLGYGDNGEEMGGYPAGYMKMGAKLNLTGKISMTNSDPAPRGVIAQLIYSALDVKMQNKFTLSDGSTTYAETQETLMEGKLKIYKIKGMVIGVGDSKMDICDTSLLDNEMAIYSSNKTYLFDYTSFFATKEEAANYLGYEVTLYYKNNGTGELDTIIAFDTESKKNDTITFNYDKIDSCSKTAIKYENEKGKIKSLRFNESGLNVIYNGKSIYSDEVEINGEIYDIYSAIKQWLDPTSDNFIYGDVKIIDTLSDDTVDIITINDYDVMMASKAVTTSDYRLTDKLVSGNYIILDPDDSSYEFTITKNGNENTAVTSIVANDIVLVAKSLDEKKYNIIVTSQPKTGKLTSLDFTEGEVSVDDTMYNLHPKFETYFDKKAEMEVGTQGKFYMDYYNNIVYCEISESAAAPYGYLVNLSYSDEKEIYYASMYIPTKGTAVKSYQLNDKIKINGNTTHSFEKILEETSEMCISDIENSSQVYGSSADKVKATRYAQPVRVDISSDKINGFVTLSDEGKTNESKSDLVRYLPFGKYKYTSSNNFDNQFYINSSTVILYIPGNRNDKDEYSKMTASALFKTGESYWLEPYDVNESKTASLLIVYGNSSLSEITKDSPINIASKKPVASVVNDDTIHRITMFTTSSISAITKNAENDSEFEDIEVGDVFQFGYNNKSAMTNKQIRIKAADVIEKLENSDFDWTGDEFIFQFINSDGEIEMDSTSETVYHRAYVANVLEVSEADAEERFIRVTRSDVNDDGTADGDEERFEVADNIKIIRFDTKKNTVTNVVEGTTTKLTLDDLRDAKYSGRDCSKLLLDVVKGEIKYIMIYEY